MKTLQSNFTTPEQSKRLLELGVPADSADMRYTTKFDIAPSVNIGFCTNADTSTPCWSVGRLMEIIDICAICDNKEWRGIEYPSTKRVKDELGLSYIEFLIHSIERTTDLLDFSKLNDE